MTRQIQDKLIYCDIEYYLNEEILEFYFREFPEKKPDFEGFMTALWRGYVATFEIKNNELLIKEIDWFSTAKEFDSDDFKNSNFPNNKYQWFSGLIRIDNYRGEFDDENNEDAIFELLEINEGNFIKHWKLNYIDFVTFKEIIFEDFKATNEYEKLFGLWRKNNPKLEDEKIDKYIYEGIIRNVRKI